MKNSITKHLIFLLATCFSVGAYSANMLVKQGQPAAVPLSGYSHILWQKVKYSQGDCPVELEAIFYWSPGSVTAPNGDGYYNPSVFVHGGGWGGSMTFNPPTTTAEANAINKIVSRGFIYIQPTYRGVTNLTAHPEIGACDHPRELIKDVEYIVQAIVARNPQIPMYADIRLNEKIRISGGSAGGHVGMSLVAHHPEWFARANFLHGLYDLQDLRANWDSHLSNFADRNLANCTLDYGDKVTARTVGGRVWSQTNSTANCAKIPISKASLNTSRAYRITDVKDGDWALVSGGTFSQSTENLGIWGSLVIDVFAHNGTLYDSSNNGNWPIFGEVIIQELYAGSVPVQTAEKTKGDLVEGTGELLASALDGFLQQSFLALPANAPILLENSFGEVIKGGSGDYPPFIIATNTGDLTLQEQALSFCNDIQNSEGLPSNEIISEQAKGVIYQCGDKGTLSVSAGGNHFAASPYAQREALGIFDWFMSNWDASHAAKKAAQTCSFSVVTGQKAYDWITNSNGDYIAADYYGVRLGTGFYSASAHYSEWDAIQNDPLYFGPHASSNPWVLPLYGLNRVYLLSPSPGLPMIDAGPYGKHHKICNRALW